MADATDYWLKGMDVAREDQKDYVDAQQKNRDYRTKLKLQYGEDWRGDEKGNTDFGASEAARQTRMARDAKAAAAAMGIDFGDAQPPVTNTDPRPDEGTTLSDYGAPKAVASPEALPNSTKPITNDLGAPSGTPVRVVTPPQLENTDSAGEDIGNWDQVMASLPQKSEPVVQPDAPRYIPVQGELGAPTPAVSAPVGPVVPPAIRQDFGQSLAPTVSATPRSPVPNASTFGAPSLPTASEVYRHADPKLRDTEAFMKSLRIYEHDRVAGMTHLSQAEEVARIRANVVAEGNAIKKAAQDFKEKQAASKNNPSEVKGLPVRLPDGSISEDHYGVLGESGAVHLMPFKDKKTSVDATPAAIDRAIKHAETVIKDPDSSADDKAQAKARLGVMLPQYYERLGVKLEPQTVTNTIPGTKLLGVPLTSDKQVVSTNYVPTNGGTTAPSGSNEMVDVIDPSGRAGKIPKSNLKKALDSGYRTR